MKIGSELGKPNTVLAVETCETLLSLYDSHTHLPILSRVQAHSHQGTKPEAGERFAVLRECCR
jgi:hypothetical protein